MARAIIHNAKEPKEVEGVWVCMCGLSGSYPVCDGSHKKTKDEEDNVLYVYDKDGNRVESKHVP